MECKYCHKPIEPTKAYEVFGQEAWHLDCGTANIKDTIFTTYADKKLILDFLASWLGARAGGEDPGKIGVAIERTLHSNGYIRSLI